MTKKMMLSTMAIGTIVSLVGCGGGSDTPVAAAVGKAFYIDSAVSGINYTCGTQEGITGTDGSFNFDVGSSCTFYLGETQLRAVDKALLKDGENIIEDDVQIAALLQSLDLDGNPSNGITITPEVVEAMVTALSTNGGDGTLPNTAGELTALVAALQVAVANYQGQAVSEADAQTHLDETNLQELIVGKTFYMVIEGHRAADNLDSVFETVFSADGRKSTTEDGRTSEYTYTIEGNKVNINTTLNTYYEVISQNTEYIEIREVDDFESRILRFYFDNAKADAYITTLPAAGTLSSYIIGKTFYTTNVSETAVDTLVFNNDGTGLYGTEPFTYTIDGEIMTIVSQVEGTSIYTNVEELIDHLRFTDAGGAETGRFFYTSAAAEATLNP